MRDFPELTKPRITALVLVCTAVGYLFGPRAPLVLSALINVLIGTALMASGTSARNQWHEADCDARVRRTCARPIPSGRIERARIHFRSGIVRSRSRRLWYGTNALAAWLGLSTMLAYMLVYTPMKRRSSACTTVGAVPGAMPPRIGYAVSHGSLDASAFTLFCILFVWQFPHFYAIAWMYREDYARSGIRMLPVVEPDGESTARRIVARSILLIPVSLLPRIPGMTGSLYAGAAVVAGAGLLWLGVRPGRERYCINARRVLLASVCYLPVLLAAMVLDSL